MKHCGLPQLPGKPPRGGYILSHDFVEAAFMRRGGWEVWLAYDLDGSYEEIPATLLEELKRDRRWCQGNIQHIRLLFTRGLFSAHRALFLHGALSYLSALLWVSFLGLSTVEAIVEAFRNPVYFPSGRALFPDWPLWHPQWALTLLATTALVLFSPKLMSILLILVRKGKAQLFGHPLKLLLSMLAEVFLAVLFAPIRMLFHTKFVLFTLLGRQAGWGPQRRSDQGTGWLEALRFHGPGMVLAFTWGAALFMLNRSFFWWNLPIFIPLILSLPLSVWSSRASVGRAFQRLGLFVIPEELDPPPELSSLQKYLGRQKLHLANHRKSKQTGFVLAVVDPIVNTLHRSLLRKERNLSAAIAERRRQLLEKALAYGPGSLSPGQKKELLSDPTRMYQLHLRVWETEDRSLDEAWGIGP
jgi:membrane glycosyltransferase